MTPWARRMQERILRLALVAVCLATQGGELPAQELPASPFRARLFPLPPYPPGGVITTYYTPATPALTLPILPQSCVACQAGARVVSTYGPASPAGAQPRRVVEIGVYDNYFGPNTVVVTPGTTVRWVSQSYHHHTVTSHTGLFDSGVLPQDGAFTFTFTQQGTYYYYCRIHPAQMRGGIVVR